MDVRGNASERYNTRAFYGGRSKNAHASEERGRENIWRLKGYNEVKKGNNTMAKRKNVLSPVWIDISWNRRARGTKMRGK